MVGLPLGEPVDASRRARRPARTVHRGRHVTLSPVNARRDAPALYACSHGVPGADEVWTYMAYGPFTSVEAMEEWLTHRQAQDDPLFFSVADAASGAILGMTSLLNIVPEAMRLEIGNIWLGPAAQRTAANTEAAYLLLRYAFEALGYRRVEWRCNALNERSRAAALRLGFSFEGIFRQHQVVKGRNRDTAWFAMLDGEWPEARAALERRLSA